MLSFSAMAEVVLIGTFHADTKIRRRWRSLVWEVPDLITQELSSEEDFEQSARLLDKTVREGHINPKIEKTLNFQSLQTYRLLEKAKLDEILIPRAYTRKRKLPLPQYIDHPAMQQERYGSNPDVRAMDNELLKTLNIKSCEEIVHDIDLLYWKIIALWASDIQTQTQFIDRRPAVLFQNDRDGFPARRIRNFVGGTQKKLVHLCGLFHTLDDAKQRTLYSKLLAVGGTDLHRSTLMHYD